MNANIYDSEKPLDFYFYDMVIDVNTLSRMNSINNYDGYGWNVMVNEKRKQNYERFRGRDFEKNDGQLKVGIIGNEGSGKTFVLSEITESQLLPGTKVNTKGISIKMPIIDNKHFIFFDSGGLDSPIPISQEMKEETFSEVFRDRDLTKDFLSSFVLHCSDMFIFVTNKFGYSEHEMLLRIKESEQHKRPMVVVHNLFNLTSVKEVEEYIESLLSSFQMKKREIEPNPYRDKNNSYFVEVNKGKEEWWGEEKNWRKKEIIHLIIASERTEAGDYYNQSAFDFIRNIFLEMHPSNVRERGKEKYDIIKGLMKFYSLKSYEYMEEPIEVEEIKYDEFEKKIYVDNDGKEIILKKYFLDELGIPYFTGNPKYECRLIHGSHILILKLELPGGSNSITINKVKVVREDGYNLIFVKGKKTLPYFLESSILNSTISSNINQGNFSFLLRLPLSKVFIEDYEGNAVWERDTKGRETGILFLTFKVNTNEFEFDIDI